MSSSGNQPNSTVGSGGIVTAAGSLSSSLTKTLKGAVALGPNSQIAPPAQAGSAVGIAAKAPQMTQRAIGNRITKGTQR